MPTFEERLEAARRYKRLKQCVPSPPPPPITTVVDVPFQPTFETVEAQCHDLCRRRGHPPPWGWASKGVLIVRLDESAGDRLCLAQWMPSCVFVEVEPPVAVNVERALLSATVPVLCGVSPHNVETVARLIKGCTCVVALMDPYDPAYTCLRTVGRGKVVHPLPPITSDHVSRCIDVACKAWVPRHARCDKDAYMAMARRDDGTLNPMTPIHALYLEYVACGGRFAHTAPACTSTIGATGDPWAAIQYQSTVTNSVPNSLSFAMHCALRAATDLDDAIHRTELMSACDSVYNYRAPPDYAMALAGAAAISSNPKQMMRTYRQHLVRDKQSRFDDWGLTYTAPPDLSLQACFNVAIAATPSKTLQRLRAWLAAEHDHDPPKTARDVAEWVATQCHDRVFITQRVWRNAWAKLSRDTYSDWYYTMRQLVQ